MAELKLTEEQHADCREAVRDAIFHLLSCWDALRTVERIADTEPMADALKRKAALEAKIEALHDMQSGQPHQWEACGIITIYTCTICGLSNRHGRGGQNTGSLDDYYDARGNKLTLVEAARLACGDGEVANG